MQSSVSDVSKVSYYLNPDGEFVIENYNNAKPFSSFLPGIAGLYGIPMWVFYVNRGQCVTSLGITNKDNAILEFFPANRAYQLANLQGYRTFIKIKNSEPLLYEPFQHNSGGINQSHQRMIITAGELKLQDTNPNLGLSINTRYFTVADENYPGLCRMLNIKNISNQKISIEVLDGLPCIIAHGLIHIIQKDLSRTAEAWVEVVNTEHNAPLFRLKAVIADKPEVTHIQDGHFYFNFKHQNGVSQLGPAVTDPQIIFGRTTDFSHPSAFAAANQFNIPARQRSENLTPCAFGFHDLTIEPGASADICSIIGHISSIENLNTLVRNSANMDYFHKKALDNNQVIDEIQHNIFTSSSSDKFDLYVKQTFLDNVLRGGIPITFSAEGEKKVFHVFSRKHGDLERDYNKFSILPTPFSQGNGNYRDINQNRRCDIWFNPDVYWSNIESFVNLIQLDGYNPLVIKGCSFTCADKNFLEKMLGCSLQDSAQIQTFQEFLSKPFTPGSLLKKIEDEGAALKIEKEKFINAIIVNSVKSEESDHGEGFWTDHWTYNLDQIETFLAVYPEKLKELLIDKNDFFYYFNKASVAPRSRRYVLRLGRPFQGYSIENISSHDEWRKKEETMEGVDANLFKLKKADGSVYYTKLISKLLCIICNKTATLDPYGVGIEMEAGKPNWYDALNGLPGMFGSSLNETIELRRLASFLIDSIEKIGIKDNFEIFLPSELYLFIKELNEILVKLPDSKNEQSCFEYWDKSNTIKEHYRSSIKNGISGDELELSIAEIKAFLIRALAKIDSGIEKARDTASSLYKSYFYHEVAEYDLLEEPAGKKGLVSPDGFPYIKPKRFIQKPLPWFLEGQVHALKILNQAKALELYKSVKGSGLFDSQLKMFKVNASLADQPEEIGRCRLFSPGWLENESIWLHMEYKFLLELLECGLYQEFFEEFSRVLVPFIDPNMYGRSIIENSSFIASSANPDPSISGTGFVARLSGSTAELVNMWVVMALGKNPFYLDANGKLNFKLNPVLPGWLFSNKDSQIQLTLGGAAHSFTAHKNSYVCALFGKTLLVYNNPLRKNTYGQEGVEVKAVSITRFDGSIEKIEGCELGESLAVELRNGSIKLIEAELG